MSLPDPGPLRTPVQYGAEAPDGTSWPINRNAWQWYGVSRIYPTVQGEGLWTGTPMTIVRLQGCPVGCVFCDTPETWQTALDEQGQPPANAVGEDVKATTAEVIAKTVQEYGTHWALVTGGEPSWYDLGALTAALGTRQIRRALETSAVYPLTGSWDHICISPKPQGKLPLRRDNLKYAHEVKWLVGREHDIRAAEAFEAQRDYREHTYVFMLQPISCSTRATILCIEALRRHPEWRLSIQTHKYLNLA
jgi:7-carboxy-7-deazaguanine synthase